MQLNGQLLSCQRTDGRTLPILEAAAAAAVACEHGAEVLTCAQATRRRRQSAGASRPATGVSDFSLRPDETKAARCNSSTKHKPRENFRFLWARVEWLEPATRVPRQQSTWRRGQLFLLDDDVNIFATLLFSLPGKACDWAATRAFNLRQPASQSDGRTDGRTDGQATLDSKQPTTGATAAGCH